MLKPFSNNTFLKNIRSYHILFILLVIQLILISKVKAETAHGNGFFNDKGPIEITSDKLLADNEKGIATFIGNVVAKQGKTTLKADWMEVRYTNKGEVSQIHARGHVIVTKDQQKVNAEEAFYYRDKEVIIFTGNPVAEDSNTIVRGTKITYNVKTGNSEVENSHLTIKQGTKKDDT